MNYRNAAFASVEIARWQAQQQLSDVLCRGFEAALDDEQPPPIDQFFSCQIRQVQQEIFRDLMHVELEHRSRRGDDLDLRRYLQANPEMAGAISQAFREAIQRGVLAETEDLGLALADTEQTERDTIGDYRLVRELGEGSFARVFLAKDLAGRLVAVKVAQQASREPHLLQRLDHPNIVKLHHYTRLDCNPPRHLLCMEYVPSLSLKRLLKMLPASGALSGATLADLLRAQTDLEGANGGRGVLPEIERMDWPTYVAWLGAQLADAVAYAHRCHVLHRDVKPANILIDRHGSPTLVDFNVSFETRDSDGAVRSATDLLGGSLAYMAPEHLEAYAEGRHGESVAEPADIYSLGVVLYELLARRRPIADATLAAPTVARASCQLRKAIKSERLEFPHHCPEELQWVLQQCLHVEPANRPTADEVRRRLQYVGSPDLQRHVVPEYQKWERRFPRLTLSLYLTPLLVLCFLPTVPVLLLGAVCYPALVLGSSPQALESWDFMAAWQWGAIWGSASTGAVVAVCLLYAAPALAAIATRDRGRMSPSDSARAARRCLTVGAWAGIATVLAWSWVGLSIPVSLVLTDAGALTWLEILESFFQSTLHGLIGFSPTFLLVAYLAMDFLVLRLIPRAEMPVSCRRWLPRLRVAIALARVSLPVAAAILTMHVLRMAPPSTAQAHYIRAMLTTLVAYTVLNEYLGRRLRAALDMAHAALGRCHTG